VYDEGNVRRLLQGYFHVDECIGFAEKAGFIPLKMPRWRRRSEEPAPADARKGRMRGVLQPRRTCGGVRHFCERKRIADQTAGNGYQYPELIE